MTDELSRFIAKVRLPDDLDGCWEWIGGRTKAGYGQIRRRTRRVYAHRFSYEMLVGPIAEALCVCHRCDNPSCVNPNHLFLGTKADNSRDMALKGRAAQGERAPHSKLTEKQVLEIRQATGSQREIGEKFGVHQSQVSRILSGKAWDHVE